MALAGEGFAAAAADETAQSLAGIPVVPALARARLVPEPWVDGGRYKKMYS